VRENGRREKRSILENVKREKRNCEEENEKCENREKYISEELLEEAISADLGLDLCRDHLLS